MHIGAGEEIFGKPSVPKDSIQNLAAHEGIDRPAREVLQAQVSVRVDLSVACPLSQVASLAGVGGKKPHDRREARVGE